MRKKANKNEKERKRMKKRMMVWLLAAALLLTQMSFAWADSGLQITGVTLNDDGSVKVSWSDSGKNGPYMVYYQFCEDESDANADSWIWREYDDPVYGKSIILEMMAPGENYRIYVEDSADNSAEYYFQAKRMQYKGLKQLRTRIIPRRQWAGKGETLDYYSASAIENARRNNSNAYGASIKVNYTDAPKGVLYDLRVVVYLPTGEPVVLHKESARLTAGAGENYSYWSFFDMEWLWDILIDRYDSIPLGTYTIGMYINDGYVGFQEVVMKK